MKEITIQLTVNELKKLEYLKDKYQARNEGEILKFALANLHLETLKAVKKENEK